MLPSSEKNPTITGKDTQSIQLDIDYAKQLVYDPKTSVTTTGSVHLICTISKVYITYELNKAVWWSITLLGGCCLTPVLYYVRQQVKWETGSINLPKRCIPPPSAEEEIFPPMRVNRDEDWIPMRRQTQILSTARLSWAGKRSECGHSKVGGLFSPFISLEAIITILLCKNPDDFCLLQLGENHLNQVSPK